MPDISTNSSIEECLAAFKDATFGEDVRNALIAAINLCYRDIVEAVWQMKKGDSITNATIQDGHLILTITDNETQESRTIDAGIVKGDKGDQGPKGDPGDTGPEHEWNVDGSFSQTSVNPVQNRVITAKLNEIITDKLSKSAVDNSLSLSSTNPVQNKIITARLNEIITTKVNKLSIDTDYVLISNGSGGLKNSLKKIGNSDSLHSENDSDYIALEGAVKQYAYSKSDSDDRYVQSENIDTELSTESENPVQNKVIATKFAEIENNYSAPDSTIDITSTKPIQNSAVAQALNEKVDSDDFSETIFDDIDLVFSNTNGGIYYNGNSPLQVPALFIEGAGTDPDFTYYLSYIDSVDMEIHRIANITSLVGKVIKIDTELNENSTNPIQNKVIVDALNSKMTVTEITSQPSSAEIAKYTDPKTLYMFYCGISGIDDNMSMIFIPSGEEADTPGGETLYPFSTQFAIAASTGKIYTRTADEDGYFGDFQLFNRGLQVDDALSPTSENPVQNKVVKAAIDEVVSHGVIIDDHLSTSSTNPIQNKVITNELNTRESKSNKDDSISKLTSDTYDRTHYPSIKCLKTVQNGYQTKIDNSNKLSSDLVDDTNQTNKFVTDTDKTNWNSKLSSDNGAVKSSNIDNGAVTLQKLASGVIDSTLSTQGAAAEAKATGNGIKADAALVAGESLITASLLEPYNATFTNVEYTTTANKTLMADGTIIDFNHSGVSNVVVLTPDTLYECNCAGVGGGGAYFFLYDKKDNISAIYPAITTDSKNFVFKASNKFKKIQFNVRGSSCYLRAITLNGLKVENNFLEVENNFIELTNHILDTVDYTRLNISFIESKHLNDEGVVQDYAGGGTAWNVSNEIDISQYDYLKINARTGYGDAFFAIYDENHNPIYVEVSPSSGISVFNDNVILPENAHYLVISKCGEAFDAYVSYPVFEAPTKKWEGKKWVCIGDSLTEANATTSKHYFDYIADETGITTANYGIGGTGYANPSGTAGNFTARMASVPTDADVYTIFGSFNDYAYSINNDIPIGTPEDSGTSTICGYINSAFDALFARVPLANLGVVAPCPWVSVNNVTGSTRAKTFAENYVSALKQCCERKSIPFLDLYHGSGLRPWDSNFNDLTYTKDNLHGIHPDETGHAILAPKFSAFLDSLL